MSMVQALQMSPPQPSSGWERGSAIHFAGHAVANAAFGRGFTEVSDPTDLCGLRPPAVAVDGRLKGPKRGNQFTDRQQAITIAAGYVAEFYRLHKLEAWERADLEHDIRLATRIDVERAIAGFGFGELRSSSNLAAKTSATWPKVLDTAMDLVTTSWITIESIAELVMASEGQRIKFDEIIDRVAWIRPR